MSHAVRWAVVAASSVAAFVVCLWATRAVSWGWLPRDDGDQWAVATAFSGVVAGVLLAAGGWWAAHGPAVPADAAGTGVRQEMDVSGAGRAEQIGGHQYTGGARPQPGGRRPAGPVEQTLRGSPEGHVRQIAGDQHLPGDPPAPR